MASSRSARAAAVRNGVSGADLVVLADERQDDAAHEAVLAKCGVGSLGGARRLVNAIKEEFMQELAGLLTAASDKNIISIEELIAHRRLSEKLVSRTASAKLPTRYGDFDIIVFDVMFDVTNCQLIIL